MKMKKEHFETLEKSIKEMLSHYDGKEVYMKKGLSMMRYRWDLFWHVSERKMLPEYFVSETLYSYLNDDHIDTALRKITNTK